MRRIVSSVVTPARAFAATTIAAASTAQAGTAAPRATPAGPRSGWTDGDASIDRDDRPRNVRPRARGEVDGHARHVLGLADPSERTGGNDGIAEALERHRHHPALEGAGRHRVHRDPARGELHGEDVREVMNRRLARR